MVDLQGFIHEEYIFHSEFFLGTNNIIVSKFINILILFFYLWSGTVYALCR